MQIEKKRYTHKEKMKESREKYNRRKYCQKARSIKSDQERQNYGTTKCEKKRKWGEGILYINSCQKDIKVLI